MYSWFTMGMDDRKVQEVDVYGTLEEVLEAMSASAWEKRQQQTGLIGSRMRRWSPRWRFSAQTRRAAGDVRMVGSLDSRSPNDTGRLRRP